MQELVYFYHHPTRVTDILPVFLEAEYIGNVFRFQIIEPVFSNEFPVGDNRFNSFLAKGFDKAFDEVYAVDVIGIAAFLIL